MLNPQIQTSEFFNDKVGGTYSYHCVLEGYVSICSMFIAVFAGKKSARYSTPTIGSILVMCNCVSILYYKTASERTEMFYTHVVAYVLIRSSSYVMQAYKSFVVWGAYAEITWSSIWTSGEVWIINCPTGATVAYIGQLIARLQCHLSSKSPSSFWYKTRGRRDSFLIMSFTPSMERKLIRILPPFFMWGYLEIRKYQWYGTFFICEGHTKFIELKMDMITSAIHD